MGIFNPFRKSQDVSASKSPSLKPAQGHMSAGTKQRQQQDSHSDQAPPPTYTEATSTRSVGESPPPPPSKRAQAHPRLTRQSVQTADDPFAFLSSFDTIFLIDDSGSMAGRYWQEARTVLEAIVPVCTAHDEDGVDIYFLNHKTRELLDRAKGSAGTGYRGVIDPQRVKNIFESVSPRGITPTGARLRTILNPYLDLYQKRLQETGDETCLKPLNVIVITDGAPSDEPDLEIIRFAEKLDKLDAPLYQVGIQFFQVGNDPEATRALKAMDDELDKKGSAGLRDMVDTTTFNDRVDNTRAGSGFSLGRGNNTGTELTADTVLKIVLGGVVKRLDRIETRHA